MHYADRFATTERSPIDRGTGVDDARAVFGWAEVHAIDEHTMTLAGRIATEVAADGQFLGGPDAMIAAVGRELNAPVVAGDSDLTHGATTAVVAVEEY